MRERIDSRGDARLRLQLAERALIRAYRARPDALDAADYEALRYGFGLARMREVTAASGRRISIDPVPVAELREWLLERLFDGLRGPRAAVDKLADCRASAPSTALRVRRTRSRLLADIAGDVSVEAFDRQAGDRALVLVAGGGGGAGYVYAGAYARLLEADLAPDYIVGNSIGAVMGISFAHRRAAPVADYMAFARNLSPDDIYTRRPSPAEFCQPGLLGLHLRALHRRLAVGVGRRSPRLADLETPIDLVAAGVPRAAYAALPSDLRDRDQGAARFWPLSAQIGARLSRLVRFFRTAAAEPVVFGRDSDTRAINAVDAAGLSSSVPSILQYQLGPYSTASRDILRDVSTRRDFAVFADGGIVDNVPVRAAWRGIGAGRLGTRNACILAFDCFLPRWASRHGWLWPMTRTVARQIRTNRVYADTLVRFTRTLSPLTVVPGPMALTRAYAWGHAAMDERIDEVRELMRPVRIDAGATECV